MGGTKGLEEYKVISTKLKNDVHNLISINLEKEIEQNDAKN